MNLFFNISHIVNRKFGIKYESLYTAVLSWLSYPYLVSRADLLWASHAHFWERSLWQAQTTSVMKVNPAFSTYPISYNESSFLTAQAWRNVSRPLVTRVPTSECEWLETSAKRGAPWEGGIISHLPCRAVLFLVSAVLCLYSSEPTWVLRDKPITNSFRYNVPTELDYQQFSGVAAWNDTVEYPNSKT